MHIGQARKDPTARLSNLTALENHRTLRVTRLRTLLARSHFVSKARASKFFRVLPGCFAVSGRGRTASDVRRPSNEIASRWLKPTHNLKRSRFATYGRYHFLCGRNGPRHSYSPQPVLLAVRFSLALRRFCSLPGTQLAPLQDLLLREDWGARYGSADRAKSSCHFLSRFAQQTRSETSAARRSG